MLGFFFFTYLNLKTRLPPLVAANKIFLYFRRVLEFDAPELSLFFRKVTRKHTQTEVLEAAA